MKFVIGDFGCGRAKLSELLEENKMYNFDHHNILNSKITACDMKSVPIKDGLLDVAVFCLSLMGKNWPDYIREAATCSRKTDYCLLLKPPSHWPIDFQSCLLEHGFEIISKEERGIFTFIDARKL
jgi:hypothetical protein